METKALKCPMSPSDAINRTIGSSKFTEDIWDIAILQKKTILAVNSKGKNKINYSCFKSESLKFVAKQFIYILLGNENSPTTAYNKSTHLRPFADFLDKQGITKFSEVTREIFDKFNDLLWKKYKAEELAAGTCYNYIAAVEALLSTGQLHGLEVTRDANFAGRATQDWWTKVKNEEESHKNKAIADDVLRNLLKCARTKEKDPILKNGIIIESQTGLRISEVLGLRFGCLGWSDEVGDVLEVFIPKSEKEESASGWHKIFVNELVVKAVNELNVITKEIRKKVIEDNQKKLLAIKNNKDLTKEQSQKLLQQYELEDISEFLFLEYSVRKGKAIRVPDVSTYRNRLREFPKKYQIKDTNGEILHLNSHRFRYTFVKNLIDQNVPLSFISKHLYHVNIEITDYYATLRTEDIKKQYGELILNPESRIAGARAKEIKEVTTRLFKGKTKVEIGEIIDSLVNSMNFNPLPTGVCLYDPRRGNCTNGDSCFFYNCVNFLTEVKFYNVLKLELDMLEKSMERAKSLNWQRDYERTKTVCEMLKPLVNALEEELHDKEYQKEKVTH